MINKLAFELSSLICTEAYDNARDRAKIQYGLTILLSEGFKIISLLVIFNLLHKEKYFYFSMLILLSTRVFSGGVHLKSTLKCLALTTLLFIFTSSIAPLVPGQPIVLYLSMSILSLLIVLIRAPICSVRRPIKEKNKKLQYKFIAAASIVLWTIILLNLQNTSFVNCGFSTIFLQSTQLVIIKKKKL